MPATVDPGSHRRARHQRHDLRRLRRLRRPGQAKLKKVDGVTATVNLATERAHITARPTSPPQTWSPWSRPPVTPPLSQAFMPGLWYTRARMTISASLGIDHNGAAGAVRRQGRRACWTSVVTVSQRQLGSQARDAW